VLSIHIEQLFEKIAMLPLATRLMDSIVAAVVIRSASVLFERTLAPHFEKVTSVTAFGK
jgi:hypothetical protein